MSTPPVSKRASAVGALLATAIVSGAAVGLIAAGFIWLIDRGTELVWVDLPAEFDLQPFDSWWIIAVPVVGALLVGICIRVVGDYPRPMEEAVARWRTGGHVPPADAPKTGVSALVVLVMGGPVGFEAALVGVLGGTATLVGTRISAVGSLVRQVWGAERIDSLPDRLRTVPYWLAAVASVMTYRWLPFGAIDMGFRFDQFDGEWGTVDVVSVFVLAMLVTVPTAFALVVVSRAEFSTFHHRSPVLIAVGGAVLFALLALGNETVLFSGQTQFQGLADESNGALLYIIVAKFAALLIALLAGWRGGPIFPMYVSIGAFAVIAADVVDAPTEVMMVGAIAAVSTVIARGSIPLGAVLTIYVVPLSFAFVILVGCLAAAVALAILTSTGLLADSHPRGDQHDTDDPEPKTPTAVAPNE